MSFKPPDNDLNRILHEADPLAQDPGLTTTDRTEMRRTILARIPERSPSRWRLLSPALSFAFLLAVALGLAWWPSTVDSPTTNTLTSSPTSAPGSAAGNALESRKIQFETPGGTLVVWVLDPNFPS